MYKFIVRLEMGLWSEGKFKCTVIGSGNSIRFPGVEMIRIGGLMLELPIRIGAAVVALIKNLIRIELE